MSLLERTEDRFWLSQALYALCYSHYYAAISTRHRIAARLDALGEATGSRRARADAEMSPVSATPPGGTGRSESRPASGPSVRAGPLETAAVLACLGKAHPEAGDLARAIPVLEQAVQLGDQVRSRQWREWFGRCSARATSSAARWTRLERRRSKRWRPLPTSATRSGSDGPVKSSADSPRPRTLSRRRTYIR